MEAPEETKKLYRSRTDRWFAGVCGGMARYFDVDSVLVRALLVIFGLTFGSGLLIYLILYIMIPLEPEAAGETETPRTRGLSPAWMAGGAIALIVAVLLIYAVAAGPSEPPEVGFPVPDFEFTALDGSTMNLGAQNGDVVVVNFFASWCAPCRQEAAALEQTWREYQDQEVQFYGIAYKDADSKAQAFLDEFDVTYPSTVDTSNRTARDYGVTGVPETFVVGRDGLLVYHFLGPITQAQLSREIERALNQ